MNDLLTRKCSICQLDLLLSNFYVNNKKTCIQCNRNKNKEWRKLNKDRINTRKREERKENSTKFYFKKIKSEYGISKEDYWKLFYLQNKCCAICGDLGREGKEQGKRNLYIDHDHLTGKVRGLLCHHCNSSIGMARDNIETLRKCIYYLELHNSYVPNYSI